METYKVQVVSKAIVTEEYEVKAEGEQSAIDYVLSGTTKLEEQINQEVEIEETLDISVELLQISKCKHVWIDANTWQGVTYTEEKTFCSECGIKKP